MAIRAWHLGVVVLGGLALLVVSVLALLAASVAGAQPSRPLDVGEQKQFDMLQKTAKDLDADGDKAARTPDGQRRAVQTLARQFKVQDTVVMDLRVRKMGWGEIAAALALSQQLMRKDTNLSQQAALDNILARRNAGAGWGMIARELGLKLGRVVSEVKMADTHMASAKPEKMGKMDRPEKMQKVERSEKPEKANR